MSRISSIVTASEPNRIVEMNRRTRLNTELTRPRAPAAGATVTPPPTPAGATVTGDPQTAYPRARSALLTWTSPTHTSAISLPRLSDSLAS